MPLPHQAAFSSRTDLQTWGNNARLLFALETKYRLEDIHTVAADALTDSPNDKKCDLVYVDLDNGRVIVGQGYESTKERAAAPANKAADLNTAIAWLLSQPIESVPEGLRSAAEQLRSALNDDRIRTFSLWYVTNLPESANVRDELRAVEGSLRSVLQARYSSSAIEEVAAIEVGPTTLEEWYQALQAPILVSSSFELTVPGAFETQGQGWSAVSTTVPAPWLYALWKEWSSKLFSANVRDYLGSRKSARNVNNGIKDTARDQPQKLCVFNNGITALVNDISMERTGANEVKLYIKGLSIVNGAQTTGAIGSLDTQPSSDARLPARFVKCTDLATVRQIIRFNNTQNAISATDFRSNDPVQRRLRDEFTRIPECEYQGGRRGGDEDAIHRTPNLLPTQGCSQALAAFHQEPSIAYHRKSGIWENDEYYARFFSDITHAEHLVFAHSLLRAVEKKKRALIELRQARTLSEGEAEQLDFLRKRGSIMLLVAAIAKCLDTVLGRPVENSFRLSFGGVSPATAETYWAPIIEATIPFCAELTLAVDAVLKNVEANKNGIAQFKRMVEATKRANSEQFKGFAGLVVES